MRAKNWIGLLLVGALGAAGCGGDDSSTDETRGDTTSSVVASTTASTTVAPAAASPAGAALFEDAFDDDSNGWGLVDDPEFGSAAFVDGDYVWEFRGSIAHWLPAVLGEQYDRGELEMRDVVVRTEATILAGGGVIGVFCRETPDTDAEWQWYEFVVRDGFAAIRRADSEGNLEMLAESHDVSLPIGQPIMIEASCVDDANGDAQLSMALNGTPVLEATDDDPLDNGVVGLQAWTFPLHEQIDIRWHEFSVHRASSAATGG
jgi:hypothetical protein